jgi:predicted nucleic acid-binding protein
MQEACALLTGDKALRKAAKIENVEVKGTVWLMEELLGHQLITKEQAVKAFDQMKEVGSRLPRDLVDEMLKKQ